MIAFQILPVLRKLLKKRTPYAELYQLINLHPIMEKMAKSFHWRSKDYCDDVRWDMRDSEIDESMFVLSDRFGKGALKLIDLLTGFFEEEDVAVSPFDFLIFYNDGSFKVECDVLLEETGQRQPPIVVSQSLHGFSLGGSICEFNVWKQVVQGLMAEAVQHSPHCRFTQ